MPARKLHLGPKLAVPDDAVTQTFLVLGKRGSGKSNTAVVLAEEMHKAGAPFAVLDPIGAWWGLKSSFDGAGAGLPVYVFGGLHGDLPLQPTAGELMAQVFVRHRQPMVLDMKGWTGADRARFVTAFAEWLLGHNDRSPAHVFLEEADAFIPQRPYKGEERMLGAMDRMIRWGRQEGLGSTTVSQRSAKINKDVTTQTEILIAHRTTGPQDRDVVRDWIKYHAGDERMQEILESLATLPDGTAWVWSPEWLGILQQVAFRRRETFDSASTPKLGEKRIQPKELAPVDLDRLRDQLAETIEKAKADDPAELRRRIRELERQAANVITTPPPEPVVERIEVPVLNGQVGALRSAIDELVGVGQRLVQVATGVGDAAAVIQSTGSSIIAAIDRVASAPRSAANVIPAVGPAKAEPIRPASGNPSLPTAAPRPQADPRRRAGADPDPVSGSAPASLGKAERAILSALSSYPLPLTREQLAFLAGYHPRSKGYINALGTLRSSGLISPGFPAETLEAARGLVPPPEGSLGDLVGYWLSRFGRAEKAILEHLIFLYPAAADREELARQAGFEHVRSKGFINALGRLRGLGLVDGLALHPDFAALVGQ